jgi:hypothetical protein
MSIPFTLILLVFRGKVIASVVSYNEIESLIAEKKLVQGTTRRYFGKVLEDVVVRRISGNIGCISVEIFVNIPSIRNIPERQFSGHILLE